MGKLSFFSKAVSQATYPCLHACRLRAVCWGESHRHRSCLIAARRLTMSSVSVRRTGERTSRVLVGLPQGISATPESHGAAHDALTKPFHESQSWQDDLFWVLNHCAQVHSGCGVREASPATLLFYETTRMNTRNALGVSYYYYTRYYSNLVFQRVRSHLQDIFLSTIKEKYDSVM